MSLMKILGAQFECAVEECCQSSCFDVYHGVLILQDAFGQVRETHSVSAGLDYSGVGPEHAYLMTSGRVAYESATDEEALDALMECAKFEGVLPAIETAHAFAGARRFARCRTGDAAAARARGSSG